MPTYPRQLCATLVFGIALASCGGVGPSYADLPAPTDQAPSSHLTFSLVHGSEPEVQTHEQLRRLLATYDVSPWVFTTNIAIDEQAIPHSHPVLTLHTKHLKQDMELLSTFLHEQMHWFLEAHDSDVEAAIKDLRKMFPGLPVGYPDGAQDEHSSYLHLIVNHLELASMKHLVGEARTLEVFKFWTTDHYRELYRIVLANDDRIGEVVQRHNLVPQGL